MIFWEATHAFEVAANAHDRVGRVTCASRANCISTTVSWTIQSTGLYDQAVNETVIGDPMTYHGHAASVEGKGNASAGGAGT